MYNYPQYIYPPTTVPVQRYFADPYVPMNSYGIGDFIDKVGQKWNSLGNTFGEKTNGLLGKNGVLGSVFGGNKISSPVGGLIGGIGNAVGQVGYGAISGKLNSGAGAAINKIGSAVGSIVGKVNPILGAGVSAVSGLVGGLTNRMFGVNFNDAAISAIQGDTDMMNNTRVADTSNQSIADQAAAQNWGGAFNMKTVGDHGWFSGGKIRNKYNELMAGMNSARNYATANYANAANNVSQNQMSNLLINTAAMGGFFDNPWSYQSIRPGSEAISYSMGQQQLANQTQMVNQMQPQQPFGLPQQQQQYCFGGFFNPYACGGRKYANGGMLNDHGSDFSNDVMYIDEGGTHEENPYQGVPMGYDSQGTPNVVEEDEVIVPAKILADGGSMAGVGDYVLSNRTYISPEFAEKYNLPEDTTHSEAAEILTSESHQNPTDIIAQNTDKVILRELVQDQEQVKQEQQQRQMMQQQMMQQTPPEQQAMMAQQQQLHGPAMEEMMAQQAPEQEAPMQQMAAFGGRLFESGGFFPKLNVFAVPGVMERTSGHRPIAGYVGTAAPWVNISAPWLLRKLTEELEATKTQAEADAVFAKYNQLSQLAKAAKMRYEDAAPVQSDEINALQEYWKDTIGGNDAFTSNALGDNFDPAYEGGKTKDNLGAGFGEDRTAGDYTRYLRNLGIGALPDDIVDRFNDVAAKYNHKYTSEGNDGYWMFSPTTPTGDEVVAAKDGNGEAYTPKGTGANTENDADDRYDTGEYEDFKGLPTWFGDIPIWMSGIASLTDALGLTNKPDFTAYNSMLNLARGNTGYMPVSYRPTGEQMKYMPYDPVMQNILNNANTAASRRAIQDNANGNGAMRNASLVALDRNANLANGQLGLQTYAANQDQYNKALTFNNATNLQNSQGMLSADAQNAQNWRYQRSMFNTLMGEAIAERAAERQRADTARALNLKSFMDSLGNKAKENKYFNMVGSNPANGGYGMLGNGVIIRRNPRMRTTPDTTEQTAAVQTPSTATNPYVARPAANPLGLQFDLPAPLWATQWSPYFRFNS